MSSGLYDFKKSYPVLPRLLTFHSSCFTSPTKFYQQWFPDCLSCSATLPLLNCLHKFWPHNQKITAKNNHPITLKHPFSSFSPSLAEKIQMKLKTYCRQLHWLFLPFTAFVALFYNSSRSSVNFKHQINWTSAINLPISVHKLLRTHTISNHSNTENHRG